MTIIWCMVPETWGVTDRISGHFGSFFPLHPTTNWKIKILKKWKKKKKKKKIFKKSKKKKKKKKTGDTIILHLCTTNDNNMMYGWDMEHEEHNFLSFWTIICPFTP